ncbi:hypothetical protein AMECASPLE_006765 [Ameca splendens]|uniref:Secreted protein n=1 Tax=Ameca splendens TaxID=208324 RepID=A0ABV0XZI2_9TELE
MERMMMFLRQLLSPAVLQTHLLRSKGSESCIATWWNVWGFFLVGAEESAKPQEPCCGKQRPNGNCKPFRPELSILLKTSHLKIHREAKKKSEVKPNTFWMFSPCFKTNPTKTKQRQDN